MADAHAGLASIGVKMYKGSSTTKTKLPNLQSTPELGGTPEKIDVTTLEDSIKQYINGVKDYGDLEFTFLYDGDKSDSSFKTLKAAEGNPDTYTLELPDGTSFSWTADVSVRMSSIEVNGALTFIASFAMQSDVTYSGATATT